MPISFSTVFADVWRFVKRPRLAHLSDSFKASPGQVLFNLLLLDFALMIPLSGLLGLLGLEDMDHKIADLTDDPLKLAGLAVVMAPIMEEAMFRLPMKFSYVRTAIALGLCLVALPNLVSDTNMVVGIAAIVLFLVFLYQFINQRQEGVLNEQVGVWWKDNFYVPFWLLTLAFALLHLSNFGSFPIHLAPFLVLPQFVLGAILGYVRTGYGFAFAVLFHALHNGILVGLATMATA